MEQITPDPANPNGEIAAHVIDCVHKTIDLVARLAANKIEGEGVAVGDMMTPDGKSWFYLRLGDEVFALVPEAASTIADVVGIGLVRMDTEEGTTAFQAGLVQMAQKVALANSGPATIQ